MCRLRCARLSLGILLLGLGACGSPDAESLAVTGPLNAALQLAPPAKVSIIAAAAAALPEPNQDGDAPPPDCARAQAQYDKAFTELNGMVEWHALHSLDPFIKASTSASAANDNDCSLSAKRSGEDCGELLGAFDDAYENLRATPQYVTLDATVEWHAVLSAFQALQVGSCL